MISALKAECRKLLSIRSTYVILGLTLLLEIIATFYATGYRSAPGAMYNSDLLAGSVTSAATFFAVFISLIGMLSMTHEYRYNTIMYTLTSAKNRTTILLAKFLVVSAFAIIAASIFGFLAPPLTALGVQAAGYSMADQIIPIGDLWWRVAFMGWGFSMLALLFATIIRSQTGAIVLFFLMPFTLEPLLVFAFQINEKYLPFRSLFAVIERGATSYERAAVTVMVYIVVGWLLAWLLFIRRDAN